MGVKYFAQDYQRSSGGVDEHVVRGADGVSWGGIGELRPTGDGPEGGAPRGVSNGGRRGQGMQWWRHSHVGTFVFVLWAAKERVSLQQWGHDLAIAWQEGGSGVRRGAWRQGTT
jgi:hypothetical protein